ncbi:hypothetical protein SBF1_8380004 [Candidatus Desulfosporosinus infrequens]|uniref:Uncharacterized protein n=1 Tax=Candidatus Desulfosporosinus infrequens TaxID=2043169 RepID=A0A2U3LUJ0_9FIRM|nr:hypothetical protein SBF1_8380004 [Candidatus Desulfosporosinus infrequens]
MGLDKEGNVGGFGNIGTVHLARQIGARIQKGHLGERWVF